MPYLIREQLNIRHCTAGHCDPSDGHESNPYIFPDKYSDKYSCPECRQSFKQKSSVEAHQRESVHAYCDHCDIFSPTRRLHVLHMQSHAPVQAMMPTPSSATQFQGRDGERDVRDEVALVDHLRGGEVHGPEKKKQKQKQKEKGNPRRKCEKCQRTFKNRGALGRHLTSAQHSESERCSIKVRIYPTVMTKSGKIRRPGGDDQSWLMPIPGAYESTFPMEGEFYEY